MDALGLAGAEDFLPRSRGLGPVGRPNGSISGTPNGEFNTSINCGSRCSARFQRGTTVSLTATPLAGHVFVNWTGACSGTVPTWDVVITKDTQAQANFK
jgi:uncharacterized repeat protein (TIGR02543 family)